MPSLTHTIVISIHMNWRFHMKVLCTIMALCFLAYEFYNYQIRRPTSISTQKIRITTDIFSGISLCPEPAFNIDIMNKHGYLISKCLYTGQDNNYTVIGWGGVTAIRQDKLLNDLVLQLSRKSVWFTHLDNAFY